MVSTPNENIEEETDKCFCVCFGAEGEPFVNPTVENPVRTEEIMKRMNLEFLRPILDELYEDDWRFHFDPLTVLKTMIYWRLKGHRFLTDVFNDLLTDPTLADILGYGFIPSYQQLYHFITYRINSKGTKKIFDVLLKQVVHECKNRDIPIGKEIVIDSSPMEKKNNGDATYSGHYGVTGYKWHNVRCVRTDIPLEYHVSTLTDYDGDFLAPLIYRIKMIHNIHPKRVFADGHYSDGKNLMRMREYFNIEPICLIDKTEVLEDFYHNQMLNKYLKDPIAYQNKYVIRESIEHCYGREKRLTEIKNIQANNMEKFTTHIGMHVIIILALALVRLQNGITENLTFRGGLV